MRVFSHCGILVAFFLAAAHVAIGQVVIQLPSAEHFKSREQFTVTIVNRGDQPVTFCTNLAWFAKPDGDSHLIDTPLVSQSWNGQKWNTLLNGNDIGDTSRYVIQEAHESHNFNLGLNGTGRMRFLVEYWVGENDQACKNPKGKRTAKSRVFTIE